MTKPHSLHKVECGCVHDNTFWVEYCAQHRKEISEARNRWDAYLAKLITEKDEPKLNGEHL